MDNQHRKISGYRELSQTEIDLMNRIKAFGPQLHDLIADMQRHISAQRDTAAQQLGQDNDAQEHQRLTATEPERWLALAKTDLQRGLMELTRAVAQPGGF